MATFAQPNPRRRYLNRATPTASDPSVDNDYPKLPFIDSNRPLKKSATFHSPTTPPSQDEDPIVNIPLLPRRSPTCPKDLENAVAAGQTRAAQLIGVVDRSLSGLESFASDSQETLRAEDLPVPRFMLDAHAGEPARMDIDESPKPSSPPTRQHQPRRKHHSSDSGIGSTVTGSDESLSNGPKGMENGLHPSSRVRKVYTSTGPKPSEANRSAPPAVTEIQSGINGATVANAGPHAGAQHTLSEFACRQIQKHIILPIVSESSLKDFHPLVTGIPYRVGRKEITCLRDLEKVLLWLAPKWSTSRASFIKFCETSIQCIHTTVEYLNEPDQRRPTDRPYTNGYFLDLTEQVRQYAAMITASRQRMAAGRASKEDDVTADERLDLHGGLSQNGRHVELVRIKNGQCISLRTGSVVDPQSSRSQGLKKSVSEESDEDVMRSMARRKKAAQATVKDVQRCSECDKVYKRPCDLTKHEKTHSRPWKCSESSCKYHIYGWPTEKERDRHVNDKHSTTPSMFKCQYHPCPYESKRESNCKQHMEKAHGWAYVRSKINGKSGKSGKSGKKPKAGKTPPTPQISTPGSYIFDASSPEIGEPSNSYRNSVGYSNGRSMDGSVIGSEDSAPHSAVDTQFMVPDDPMDPFNSNFAWNESWNGLGHAGPSDYTPDSHRLSWDEVMTNAPTLPSPFETSLNGQDAIFTENFDWSNLDTNYTSMNIQLITPENSIDTRSMDAFSRNPSISLEEPPDGKVPSLSPGGQGNVMLCSPYSQNEASANEGYDDFVTETGKPSTDFALFGDSNNGSSLSSADHDHMFPGLGTFPTNWSGRGTEFVQLGVNDLMQVDEE